uniref:NADH-ubiquinone oxidoreductase chain 1 n=1 Tax=Haustorioides koreanus TaxID=2729224 RepID=A0A6M3RIZ6_9CRUS|nr:NADH dehydrogenase subunit 1 [Haustorioides koreanus]
MEFFNLFIMYLILFIMVLISVAFITLLERKALSSAQVRVGPNTAGFWGLLQPFSDAIKLFTKESVLLRVSMMSVYYISPVLGMLFMLILWLVLPLHNGGLLFNFGLMYFVCVSGAAVYPILSSGWTSNCKYSMLGSLRAVAQMLSYEVSLMMVLLSVVWLTASFNLDTILECQKNMWNLFFFFPLALIWFASSLAETNRTPYDFAEGESELVSGFNTEYGAGGFSLIFLAEYGNIIFMSAIFSLLFLTSSFSVSFPLKTMLLSFLFVWVRASFPRYRYDLLMGLAWKSFLPVTLFIFLFYYAIVFS